MTFESCRYTQLSALRLAITLSNVEMIVRAPRVTILSLERGKESTFLHISAQTHKSKQSYVKCRNLHKLVIF